MPVCGQDGGNGGCDPHACGRPHRHLYPPVRPRGLARMRGGVVNPTERLQALEVVLDDLRQAAAGAAVIIEGRRDDEALEALGIGGVHLRVHTGVPLEARIDEIATLAEAAGWRHVLLLTDWDRTGGRLATRLEQGLAARIRVDTEMRRRLARATQAVCIEDVPGDLASLRAWGKRP